MLPTKFRVNWPFCSEEAKNRFSGWPPWRPSWISDQNNFSFFDLQVTSMLPTKFQVIWPFGEGEEAKNSFQVGRDGGHLGFPIGTILATFYLHASNQVSSQLALWFRRRSEK